MNLCKTELKFMGHLIKIYGLKPDPDKIKNVENIPKPISKQEVLRLLGFINYLAIFMLKLAGISQQPRESTTKKVSFNCHFNMRKHSMR